MYTTAGFVGDRIRRMDEQTARLAAAQKALELVPTNETVIGLGSGRAVFELIEQIRRNRPKGSVKAVVASSMTAARAADASIKIVELNAKTPISIAFDGADEIDEELRLIKGGGAALLREKLLLANAAQVVILAEENKISQRLGAQRLLPIEIVRFGWTTTLQRVLQLANSATLRLDAAQEPVITDEGHYLLDIPLTDVDPDQLAQDLKATLGVVEHGLFINVANQVIVGQPDGTTISLKPTHTA